MNLHDCELFANLSKTLNYSKTSRDMNISPSALSRTIQRLEEELGKILFLRDNRRVSITEEGKIFLSFASTLQKDYQELLNAFNPDDKNFKGTLRIYASVTASYTILTDILKLYRIRYPKVHIDLLTGSAAGAIEQVLENKVDITIAARPKKLPPSLSFLPLIKTPLHFICPAGRGKVKDKIDQNPIRWEEVPFILADRGVSRAMINHWFLQNHIHPEVYASVSGNEAIISMVALGFGVGVVPGLVIEKSPMRNDIQNITNAPALDPYTVGLCASHRMLQSSTVKSLWKTAKELKGPVFFEK